MTGVELGILCTIIVIALVVNAVGAWVWSRAIADAHRARAHAAQADATEETLRDTEKALDGVRRRYELPPMPGHQGELPSDKELRQYILDRRQPYDDTATNENQGDRLDLERANQFAETP